MHWILGIGLAALMFVILKQWGGLTPEKRKAATWKVALAIFGAILVVLVLTGRVHVQHPVCSQRRGRPQNVPTERRPLQHNHQINDGF